MGGRGKEEGGREKGQGRKERKEGGGKGRRKEGKEGGGGEGLTQIQQGFLSPSPLAALSGDMASSSSLTQPSLSFPGRQDGL